MYLEIILSILSIFYKTVFVSQFKYNIIISFYNTVITVDDLEWENLSCTKPSPLTITYVTRREIRLDKVLTEKQIII